MYLFLLQNTAVASSTTTSATEAPATRNRRAADAWRVEEDGY